MGGRGSDGAASAGLQMPELGDGNGGPGGRAAGPQGSPGARLPVAGAGCRQPQLAVGDGEGIFGGGDILITGASLILERTGTGLRGAGFSSSSQRPIARQMGLGNTPGSGE